MTRLVLTVDEGQGQAYELPTSNAGSLLVEIEPVPSGVPGVPVDVDATAAAVGSSGASATADHKHHLAVGSPVAVALANADGLASTAARSDHVHALTAALASQVYAANWAVADWYIDGTVGNDGNNGTDPGTPLRTGAELCRRLGPYALWGQSVTVHVLANGMTDGLNLRGCLLVAGTHLDVIGTSTTLVADVVASFNPRNHATPVASQISTVGTADLTPYQWRRMRLTTGANVGAIAWIAKSDPAGAGVAIVRTSQWVNLDLVSTSSYRNLTVVPAPGDGIAIESLSFVPAVAIDIDGIRDIASGPSSWTKRILSVIGIGTRNLTIAGIASYTYGALPIFGCRISNAYVFDNNQNSLGIGSLTGCNLYWDDPGSPVYRVPEALVECSLFGDGSPAATNSQNSLFISNCLFQGLNCQSGDVNTIQATDNQIFDVVGATSIAFAWKNGRISNLSGTGNAGFGIGLANRSSLSLLGTINLLATVSSARLTTAPAINLTLPQLLQPSDYAQKGTTPAMVAGATTVTVPWYENTVQKVTTTHATFGGTPGVLRVTQTSTTQFTITSSSALDTSTVNWQISPLGRNIFVSTS